VTDTSLHFEADFANQGRGAGTGTSDPGAGAGGGSNFDVGQFAMGTSAITATAGAVISAISAFYGAKVLKERLKQEASAFEFQKTMATMNRQLGEERASAEMRAAQQAKEQLGLQAGQETSAIRARTAGRGISLGVGSAAEVEASRRVIAAIDKRTIDRNAVRAANAARRGAVSEGMRARMLGASAANARASADSINPFVAGGAAALSGASRAGLGWHEYARYYG